MNKINFKIKDNKYIPIIVTGICSIIVVIILYILNEVAPFGDNSMLTVDFYHQYGPMLGELYDRVKSGHNLFYSFNMGMGLPFFRNYFNYMASLFNIILFFVKRSDLLSTYSIIIGLKAVASAVCMNILLNYKFKGNKMNIPLAIIYAFNNYFVAYYWNIMWIDGLVFLPLITLGIEKLVKDDNIYVYIISLALMLYSNYFIGYMLCIYSVIYFIAYLFLISDIIGIKTYVNKALKFMISSLLAGGLVAFALVPMFKAMSGISATSDVWQSSQYYDFTLIEYIYNHLSGVNTTVFKSDIINAPNISSSVIVIPLLILFLLNNKIKLKTKIGYTIIIGVLIASFFIAPLDFIWHAFHVPNDLPYRYSFIYPFILVLVSGYSIYNIKNIKDYFVIITFVLTMLFVGSSYFVSSFDISDKIVIVNFIIIILWFLLYVIYKYFNNKKKIVPYICVLAVMLEAIICVNNNWEINQDMNGFYEDYNLIESNLHYIKSNEDDLFYRLERKSMLTFNDPSWYGYHGINAFSSMEYENLAVLQNHLGMPGNYINSFYYSNNTPIYDMMFNLKYIIGDIGSSSYYDLFHENILYNNYIYKSKIKSNLMYVVSDDVKKWDFLNYDPFMVQNDFVDKAFGISDILEKVNISNDKIVKYDNGIVHKYSFNSKEGYIYLSDNINTIIIDGVLYSKNEDNEFIDSSFDYYTYENVSENKMIYFNNIDSVYVAFNNEFDNDLLIYNVNDNKLNELNNMLVDNKVNISYFEENKIHAYVNSEGGTIYTSIPYDEGWNVYVDDEKVDTFDIGNCLLGFDVLEGEHNIVFEYHIPYFKISTCISIISLSLLVGYYVHKKKKI